MFLEKKFKSKIGVQMFSENFFLSRFEERDLRCYFFLQDTSKGDLGCFFSSRYVKNCSRKFFVLKNGEHCSSKFSDIMLLTLENGSAVFSVLEDGPRPAFSQKESNLLVPIENHLVLQPVFRFDEVLFV